MCLKCRENGTYCDYMPSQRRGKGKAGPRPARHNHQVPPHLTGKPSYLGNVTDGFWVQDPGFISPYEQHQQAPVCIITCSSQDNVLAISPASMPDGSTSASPNVGYRLHLGQDTIPFGFDELVEASGSDPYRHLGHSRSNSCDTSTAMSRTNSGQAARDIQQTYDLSLTPFSTPPRMGPNSPSFLPANSLQSQVPIHAVGSHIVASKPGGQLYNPQQFSSVVPRSDGTGSCECFNICQQCLGTIREIDLSNVAKIVKTCGIATHACSCLLGCLHCRNTISADTISLVASVIDKVACLYRHAFDRLDEDIDGGFGLGGSEHMQQVVMQRVAMLREVVDMFIETCNSLPEAHAIALAWVNRINHQMAWTDGLHFAPAQTIQGGNFVDSGLGFI